jgi:hypothetical protein
VAVERSPFSKKSVPKASGYGFDSDGNPVYVKGDGTLVPLSVNAKSGEKSKTTFSEEKNVLDQKTKQIVMGLSQNPKLSFAESAKARAAAMKIASGGTASVTDKGPIGSLLKGISAIPLAAGKAAYEVYDTLVSPIQQTGQSLVKELADTMRGEGPSLDDFVKQARTKGFSAAEASGVQNKFVLGITNFALDTVFDPTTYLTLGASAASKATRFALANKAALLASKYPELKPLLSNIARYGASVIPKNIREAEGIVSGVKYMGKQIPYSSGLAKAWRYTVAPVRAGIGDVVGSTTAGKALLQKTTVESLKDLTLKGFGRKATQNIYKPEFVQGLMEMSASDWAKGTFTTSLRTAVGEISQTMENARAAGLTDETVGQVYKAIERGSDDGLSDAAKQVYADYKGWADKLRNEVVELQYKLGDAYGLEVSQMGYLENHLFHKITPEAKAWTLGEGGVTKSGYRATNLTEKDLLETGGTLSFRKLRAPVYDEAGKIVEQSEFLGRKVDDATIDGLNKISNEELGFKWFEDDLGNIAQGYAESIARAKSRIAYVDRAMGYGPDAIKPLVIEKIVKDPALVDDLIRIRSILVGTQKKLRTKVRNASKLAGTREGVAQGADDFSRVLDDILEGRYVERQLRDAEIDAIQTELNEVWDVIESARLKSLRVSQDAKGEFDDIWGGYLRNAEALRDAIKNNTLDRYSLRQDLRKEYVRLGGVDSGAEALDDQTLEWFAERITRMRNGGKSKPREQARLLSKRKQLRATLDEMPAGVQFDASRNRIVAELDKVDVELEGVRVLSDVRESASYANDGVIWGSVPDATDVEAPFQVWTTKPVDDEFGTFSRVPDSLMGHAIPEDELVDFRNSEMMQQVVSPETVSDTVAKVFRETGIDDPTWASVVDEVFNTGEVSETLRIVSPAKADLLEGFLDFTRMVDDAVEQGADLTSFEIESFFGWLQNNFQQIAAEYSIDNSDNVARGMVNDFLRGLTDDAADSGFRGTLVPMRTVFPDMEDISSEWAVLLPKDTPTPKVGFGVTDEWQTVMDNPLAESILRGSKESYELDLISRGDSLRTEGIDLQAMQEARDSLAKELDSLNNPADNLVERMRANETVRFEGKDIPIKKARKQLAQMDSVLARETGNVDRQIENILANEFGLTEEAVSMRMSLEERLPVLLDNATAMQFWDGAVTSRIDNERQGVKLLLNRKPAKGSTGASNAAWVRDMERALENSALMDFDPALKDAYDRVVGLIHVGEIELGKIDNEVADNALKLSRAKAGEIGKVIFEDAERGWEALEGMGVQVPDEVAAKWAPNLKKLRDTAEAEKMFKYANNLNNYWKRYVTASVGFFMRNGFSGAFMNYADGVGVDEMNIGLRWARAQAESKGKRAVGETYANWMTRAGLLTDAEMAEAELVQKIVAATGRGQSDDMALPTFGLEGANGNVVSRASNKYLGFYSRKNDFVENALRIPMALDSVRRGMDFDEAVARIRRVHFDYTDLSALDVKAKKVVPFWLWTSRNIPLQVSQMVTRPKAYIQYERIKREFPVNSELLVPSWIQKAGPLGAGLNAVLTPDLPMVRLAQNIKDIGTPSGLIGMANPLLRVPAELWLGKQVALDIPFGDKRTANGVESAVAKLLYNLSGTQWADIDPASGKMMIDPKATYIIEQALPTLAQAFRLSGGKLGGKESLEERWLGNVLNWFGVPYRQIGESQQRGEAIRRKFNLQDLEKELKGVIKSRQMTQTEEPVQP